MMRCTALDMLQASARLGHRQGTGCLGTATFLHQRCCKLASKRKGRKGQVECPEVQG